jgi:hypothetical protein
MTVEMETLSLPTQYSLGRITAYPPGEHEHPQLLDALGEIQIPKNARLFLDFSQRLCDDLSSVRLVPDRLLENGISLVEKNLDKADFQNLREVKPSSLVIRSCNEIRMDQLRQLSGLESLIHLNLAYTPLDGRDFSWIAELPNLKTLILSGIGTDDECLKFIADLAHLENLHLDHSKVSDQGVAGIWRMAKLKDLNLGDCPIGDRAFEGIGRCKALRSLDIYGTAVSDRGVEVIVAEALNSGPQISSFVLRSCRISDQALVRLASLGSLTFLDVFETEVTPAGTSFLKNSLPGCRIFVEPAKRGGPRLWQVNAPNQS